MDSKDSFKKDQEKFTETLEIEGRVFSLVKIRDYNQGAIYQSEDGVFLRIGEESVIGAEQVTHEYFESKGFPLPELLEQGNQQGLKYYTETSVGKNTLSVSFGEDFTKTGKVSDENFGKLLSIAEEFVIAQVENVTEKNPAAADFFDMTQFLMVREECPELGTLLNIATQKIQATLAGIPLVPTHGDFNPANIFEEGVIDFSYHSFAPAGYDLACLLVNTYYFPKGVKPDFEMVRKSEYTSEQWQHIFDLGNKMYAKLNIHRSFEETFTAFAVARMVWGAARMGHTPKVQAWRFQKLKDLLECYNMGGSVANIRTIIKR
jgi:hypothetical protein